MSSYELEGRIRELRQLQSLIEEAQAEAEAIKDTIKATRVDTKALKAAAPELVERFTEVTTARRFCVA